jgi:3-isopropylmalate dehydrogenase
MKAAQIESARPRPDEAGDSLATDRIVCLPGDGIGPEVAAEALRVLEALPLAVEVATLRFGGAAIDATGVPLPAETLAACLGASGVLLGAVGGARWDGGSVRPEQGLIRLRRELDVYANLRPAVGPGVDLVVVRELVGGLYYGRRGVLADGTVFDTCEYHPDQVERIARRAFELAQTRRGLVTSVDKANVLDTSRLWRRVVDEVAAEFPAVRLRHALVDSFAMEVVTSPERLDVVVTENTFGDILSDIAAAVTGGLGLAASASLGDTGPGIFEPVHGSAPDIAGTGSANPAGMLRSVALLLEHGLGRADLAATVDEAVDAALVSHPTRDAGGSATTTAFGDAVLASLDRNLVNKESSWTNALQS